jgi:protein-disulfide isomerase
MRSWRLMSTGTGTMVVVTSCTVLLALMLRRELWSNARSPDPTPQHIGELLSVDGASTMGSPDASVVLVVFVDYQCPFCARFGLNELQRVASNYVSNGKVMIAVMNSPIRALHPMAVGAAETAECAGQEGHFWPMHDLLFRNQKSLDLVRMDALWVEAGLDRGRLTACRSDGQMLAKIREQSDVAKRFDVNATPTIAIGPRSASVGRVLVTQRFDGVPQDPILTASLDKAISR